MKTAPKKDHDVLAVGARAKLRFWSNVKKTKTCWVFGKGSGLRHATFSCGQSLSFLAHRAAKLWATGRPMLNWLACHKCTTKNCVRPSHLYWGTHASNLKDRNKFGTNRHKKYRGENHYCSKLTESLVRKIYKRYAAGGVSARAMAKKHNVSPGSIYDVLLRKSWKHVTEPLPPIRLQKTQKGYARGMKNHRTKISDRQSRQAVKMRASGKTYSQIGAVFGVSANCIFLVCKRMAKQAW